MKVLMISGDTKLLEPGTPAHRRLALQRTQVDVLDVFVWPQVHSLRDIGRAATPGAYDVVTAQDPFWRGYIAYHFAKRCGARLNLQMHTEFDAQSLWRRIWGAHNLRRADSVRVVSQKIKDSLARLQLRAPVAIVPIYLDLSKLAGLRHQPHPTFKKTVLWIGRFETEKDPLKMLAIFSDIRREADAGLIMLGDGSMEALLRERARAKKIDAFVEFPGWQEPASYLAQADVVVCTSHYEGYGASIVEALAAGVPVVAPDVGVAKEAGAIVVPRERLAQATLDALRSGVRGRLQVPILNESEWAAQWKQSL